MSGRRSHHRFKLGSPAEGTLRVLRDVIVETQDGREVVVIGREAAAVGETLTFQLVEAGQDILTVQVADSRPVVTEGAVRHRLRLTSAPGGAS